MDIISCHDCQFVKCKNQILSLLGLIASKRKYIYIHYEIMKMNATCNGTGVMLVSLIFATLA